MGCEHLLKAKWDNLQNLNLGNSYLIEGSNNIGVMGCKHFSKVKLINLQKLNLGNNYLIEG